MRVKIPAHMAIKRRKKARQAAQTGTMLPRRDGSTCINRTLRMRGWLTDYFSDVSVLGVLCQANTLPF